MDTTTGNGAPSITIPTGYNGPDGSGNGGYTAGLLAARLTAVGGPAVQVTLRVPPPLDHPLAVEGGPAGTLGLTDPAAEEGARLVAEAAVTELPDTPDGPAIPGGPVGVPEAAEAENRYPGLTAHPFPRCYSCGPERAEGEGLRLFAGPVRPGTGPDAVGNTVACTWTPHPSLDEGNGTAGLAQVWAALDCPGGWSSDVVGRPAVLGRIAVRVDHAPRIGDTHVVMGHLESVEGRKIRTGSALYDAEGRLLALARATWIALRT
ncbi:hypothetical protein A6A08_16110 [Nocardiopsis sp. TSRI0078]|uniref:hypothetical protein n=1 Tax=unclassified Nocardiopsis TaxID=2649073 RepID=UPI00093BEF81|nr:hypothetical protein [Nocardiopsis sp. TSRI0078]OKI12973.1 hypothetical protein A6A08_16110 [Nocardiopsis sp. TSRI0078]